MKEQLQTTKTRIQSVEDISQAVIGSQFEMSQLTRESVSGNKLFVNAGGAMLSSGQFSGGVRARGLFSDDDYSFGILLEEGAGCRHWLRDARRDDVGLFPAGSEHDAMYFSGATYAALTVSEADLVSFAARQQLDLRPHTLRSCAILRSCRTLGTLLREMLPAFHNPLLPHAALGPEIREQLMLAFISTLLASDSKTRLPRLRKPQEVVHEALRFLDTFEHRPVTIHDLTSLLNVSRRTLERAFVSVTSFPPGTYIRISRLNGVRRMLTAESRNTKSVTNAAIHWGFTHLGRFSADYRSLFGELPSETLRRAGGNLRH